MLLVMWRRVRYVSRKMQRPKWLRMDLSVYVNRIYHLRQSLFLRHQQLNARLGTNQGASGLTTSLVTTTVSRQIATATYEHDTLTEYTILGQHITLTTTAAATATSSHDPGIETIAVVVLAGGVAWFLAGRGHNVSQAEGS